MPLSSTIFVQHGFGGTVRLRDSYDVPEHIVQGTHSPAFRDFLWNWFGDTTAVTGRELDLSFVRDLSSQELEIARGLIRRNLSLRQTHIIEGAAALGDVDAVPLLRQMLQQENDISRRLVIAGALWKLVRDPVFLHCLEEGKQSGGRIFANYHLYQVLWLNDERALDLLIDLLAQPDSFVQFVVLQLLNTLELDRRVFTRADMQFVPYDYISRRGDVAFRKQMTAAILKWNRDHANYISNNFFGWE